MIFGYQRPPKSVRSERKSKLTHETSHEHTRHDKFYQHSPSKAACTLLFRLWVAEALAEGLAVVAVAEAGPPPEEGLVRLMAGMEGPESV